MYIPFGKLFHIFQRPGNLGVAYYKRANADGPAGASAARCGEAFASAQQVADLKEVLPQVGFDYGIDGGGNYQDTCPRVPPRARSRWPSRRGSEGSADGPPADHRRGADRPLRPAPQRGAARRLGRRASRSTAR